ncbi:MAG: DNA recombination protein RmuC, partial [Pseudomonadota bacterium]
MIQIGDQTISLSDPMVIAALAAGAGFLLIVLLLILSMRAARRAADPLIFQMSELGRSVQTLQSGQEQLTGGLRSVSDAQANAQTQVIQTMEMRLATVHQQMQERLHENAVKSARAMSDMQERMNETLSGGSEKTTKSLTELQERLATIDKAQENITKLSGDVLSLQDILSNKQTRGAFGEIQLTDIVSK